jgi:hypothetical protein
MHVISLHPIDPAIVEEYVAVLNGQPPRPEWNAWFRESLRQDLTRARKGDEAAANRMTHGLAFALSQGKPAFTFNPFGLSFWEAQVDRPIGMLMRPPSRLFLDAGLDQAAARTMPIRLDFQLGMMGGAYIPARLVDRAVQMLDEHLERSARRLAEAEYDAVASTGLMVEALTFAREQGVGLFEAQGVVGPGGEALPGISVVMPDRQRWDRTLVARIEEAITPPKQPGLFQRMLGRGKTPAASNGYHPDSGTGEDGGRV